ncbi:MAG TPA: DNA polymerase III subunit delta' [Gemmataceae bacterium]|nr:DNA polymerase III subunit delta' [Gemmataceae bacterium]
MSWSKIIGHEERIAAFRQIVARHRLAHAYLFVGPAGVGKRTFALELAKALLCEGPGKAPDALEACDQCDACLWVDAGTHPDLFQVRRPEDKNEMPIEVMTDCCRNFSLKPARGRGKIGIVDDADDFNEESANCFLKTLEEPPPGSLFLLIGTSLDRQLPTIKSRCQMVRFAPLPDAQVRLILQKQGIEEAQLDRLVRLSAGSPGQAVALEDESLWAFRREALQALAQPKMDSVALGKEFVKFAEKVSKETALQRRWAYQALKLLIDVLIDAMRLQAGAPARSAESAELPSLAALAQKAQPDTIHAMLERCLETETQLSRYVQLSLVLEALTDALGQMLDQNGPLPLRYQGFTG